VSSAVVGLLVFMFVFAGALVGVLLNRLLPDEHLLKETQDVIRLSTGMLSVLASLVLGLLIASAKTSFDRIDTDVRQFSSSVIELGDSLRGIGPPAAPALTLLHDYTTRSVLTHSGGVEEPAVVEDATAGNLFLRLRDSIIDLPDSAPRQAMLRAQAWGLFQTLQQRRWDIIQEPGNTFPGPVLYVLVAWIALIFMSFGLNAPRNITVLVALLICSAAIGGAIFLVDEMDAPFDGLIQISGEPMQKALAHLSPRPN
jgi:hypothetical protein